tara:strand:+ start:263 stop:454 length:192 start_codon:yes stop_codon:yes gene_type:complete
MHFLLHHFHHLLQDMKELHILKVYLHKQLHHLHQHQYRLDLLNQSHHHFLVKDLLEEYYLNQQ